MKSKEEIQYIQRRVSIIYGEKQRNSKETDLGQETQKGRVSTKHNKRRRRRDRGNKEDRPESTKLQNQKKDQIRKRTRK